MLPLLLSIAIGQPAPATLADLEFVAATESFVAAQPGTSPPEPFRSLIDRLGADCYRCREIASRELLEASREDLRWIMWGRMSRDPEVRLRSNAIIRRLHPCTGCGGSGHGERRYVWDNGGWYTSLCEPCGGTGSIWAWGAFDR